MNSNNQKSAVRFIIAATVTLAVAVLLAVPLLKEKTEKESVTYRRMLMGTMVEITLVDGTESSFDAAAEAGFAEIKRLEALLSSYNPSSDVTRISQSAGNEPVKVAPEVLEVVKKAVDIARLSGGAFDPTIGALAKLWGYSGESGVVPSSEEVSRVLPLVDYRNILIDEAGSTVALAGAGTTINLGGVAKGYIVGKAARAIKALGVRRAIIRAGGDMTVFDTTSAPKPFIIGIRHPREKEKLLGEIHVASGAVATSGDYERYFMKDGIRYHHILDPATGFPARGSRSVTIAAEDPSEADALSTAVFVMGPEKGMKLAESLDGVEALIVDEQGNITRSSGFEGVVR